MEIGDLLRRLVAVLEELELPYLITGSMASTLYGEPRLTNDIDVVVDLPLNRVGVFCAAFADDDFYLDDERIRQAIVHRSQFNIIDPRSGYKIDVMIPEPSPFDRSRFARGRREQVGRDYTAVVASPEDVILKKLEFHREGGSDKHLRDIAGMLEVSGDEIDRGYVEEWAERLGVAEIWRAILQRLES